MSLTIHIFSTQLWKIVEVKRALDDHVNNVDVDPISSRQRIRWEIRIIIYRAVAIRVQIRLDTYPDYQVLVRKGMMKLRSCLRHRQGSSLVSRLSRLSEDLEDSGHIDR